MLTLQDRLLHDSKFRCLVDVLYAAIERADFTPTEIREAAMLAQMRYEDCRLRRILVLRDTPCE